MPKLYEYFGLIVYFYANEHQPIHVHGQFQGFESKAEFILKNGKIVRIVFSNVAGRPALPSGRLKDFKKLARANAEDIVHRWIDFFVLQKHVEPRIITRKLR